MAQQLSPDDSRLSWPGAISIEVTDQWVGPWRIEYDRLQLFYPEALQQAAAMPSGVRIAFRSDTTLVAGDIVPQPELARLDLCCDGELVGSIPMCGKDSFWFDGLSPDKKLVELWLLQAGVFRLKSLQLSDGAFALSYEDDRPRWVTYGSSITHCYQAESPTQTWPAIVARAQGLNLTNLGVGGQCHLDPAIGRMIRDLPADCISLCLNVNIWGASSLGPRAFRPAIFGFVQTIRDGHPIVPIVLMSCINLPGAEGQTNVVGFTLSAMRQEVAAAVEVLRAYGDKNVHYADGTEVFGPELAELQPDGVHPNAEGCKALGRNFLEKVAARYFPSS